MCAFSCACADVNTDFVFLVFFFGRVAALVFSSVPRRWAQLGFALAHPQRCLDAQISPGNELDRNPSANYYTFAI